MHIHHVTSDGRALVFLPTKWEQVPFDDQQFGVIENDKVAFYLFGEFRWAHGGDVYRAVRKPSGYGWCSWDIYLNGVKTSHTGDLPERISVYVPVEVARQDGCKCPYNCCRKVN